MAVSILDLEEVGEQAESGATEPYLCRLSDDQTYVVKGRSALARGLISEAICAAMGREFGLPVPPFTLVQINPALFQFDPDARRSLGSGVGFGSLYLENLIELGRLKLGDADIKLVTKLFIFDYWIANGDRTGTEYGGNSNLFLDVKNNDLVVLDHNLAFAVEFDNDSDMGHHICRDFWVADAARLWSKASLLTDMERVYSVVDPLFDELPDTWLDEAPTMRAEVDATLSRFRDDDFWSGLP